MKPRTFLILLAAGSVPWLLTGQTPGKGARSGAPATPDSKAVTTDPVAAAPLAPAPTPVQASQPLLICHRPCSRSSRPSQRPISGGDRHLRHSAVNVPDNDRTGGIRLDFQGAELSDVSQLSQRGRRFHHRSGYAGIREGECHQPATGDAGLRRWTCSTRSCVEKNYVGAAKRPHLENRQPHRCAKARPARGHRSRSQARSHARITS